MNLRNNFGLLLVALSFPYTYTNAAFRGGVSTSSSSQHKSHVVAIYKDDVYACIGSLITFEYVVTTLECLKKNGITSVKAGINSLSQTKQAEVRKSCVSIYREDKGDGVYIGIIRVFPPFDGDTVGTIKLCTTELKSGTELDVSGWCSRLGNEIRSTVEILPEMCHFPCYLYDEIIQISGYAATSELDSGAPGVVKGGLCAVASNYVGSSSPFYIDVSPGSAAFKFIKNKIKS